jgi:hypothetical protein
LLPIGMDCMFTILQIDESGKSRPKVRGIKPTDGINSGYALDRDNILKLKKIVLNSYKVHASSLVKFCSVPPLPHTYCIFLEDYATYSIEKNLLFS